MNYETVVFIDTNVILQCLSLSQLPWFEIDKSGPVLVLVTPTVLREVDSKKNDGRLGDHARRLNNLLRPLLGAEEVVIVRPSPAPRVDVALAKCSPIMWDDFPDLDKSEPDACIIAEVLHTEVPELARKVFVSQDIHPLDLARRHGIKIHHVGENWLRQKEMSPAEKKAASLEREIAILKSNQPELLLEWDCIDSSFDVLQVNELSKREREDILSRIRRENPRPQQDLRNRRSPFINDFNRDHTLDERYDKWSEHLLPEFVDDLEKKMEILYNQVEISIVLKNVGQVRAESLLLEITAVGGWMNSKLILVSPSGPSVPTPRPFGAFGHTYFPDISGIHPRPGRHDVVVEEEPLRSDFVRVACEDFRHGLEYEYKFVAWLDPRSEEPLKIEAVATAANLQGEVSSSLVLQKKINLVSLEDLIDLNELKYSRQSLAQERLLQSTEDDFSAFEFD